MLQAAEITSQVSFNDRLCLVMCRENDCTCVTNDGALRRLCERHGVATRFGLGLLVDLVAAGALTRDRAEDIARPTCNFASGSAQPGRESEMKTDADEIDGTMTMPVTEDAREMCFAQGKSCVYASDDDRFIISETPTGVIDRHELATGKVTRVWPDGTEETFPADSPKHDEYPVWPRPTATRRAKGRR